MGKVARKMNASNEKLQNRNMRKSGIVALASTWREIMNAPGVRFRETSLRRVAIARHNRGGWIALAAYPLLLLLVVGARAKANHPRLRINPSGGTWPDYALPGFGRLENRSSTEHPAFAAGS